MHKDILSLYFSIITLKANVTSLVLFLSITSYCCSVLSLYTYYITRLLENWYQYTFSSLFRHHLTFQDCAKQSDQNNPLLSLPIPPQVCKLSSSFCLRGFFLGTAFFHSAKIHLSPLFRSLCVGLVHGAPL